MKARTKKLLTACVLLLAAYFGAYFLSVRTNQWAYKGNVVPIAYYRPLDAELIQAVFKPAHLIDATYFRPVHWEPRTRG